MIFARNKGSEAKKQAFLIKSWTIFAIVGSY